MINSRIYRVHSMNLVGNQSREKNRKKGVLQGVPILKTDSSSVGIDTIAFLRNEYT